MKKPTPKRKKQQQRETEKEITVAKYGLRNTIIVAVLGLIGTFVTAYFGFLATRQPATPTETFTSSQLFSFAPVSQGSSPVFQRDPNTGYRVIYPSCKCEYSLDSGETILIRLRWGAKNTELAEKGANLISYSLAIDGDTVSGLEKYRRPAILEESPIIQGDPANAWWVYWDYPIYNLGHYPNPLSIQVSLKTLAAIDNGQDIIPAGFVDQFGALVKIYEVQYSATKNYSSTLTPVPTKP